MTETYKIRAEIATRLEELRPLAREASDLQSATWMPRRRRAADPAVVARAWRPCAGSPTWES